MKSGELFEVYFDWLKDTESPLIFHRWALVSALSTTIGRNLCFGEGTPLETYANQYIILVGPPASRKNTALRFPRNLLRASGFNRFSSDRSSKEKFIQDLAGVEDEATTTDLLNLDMDNAMETLIYAPELQDFFGQGNMDFISFLTNMWDMPEEYKHSYIKTKQTTIRKPTINLIGGATATTLSDIFPDKISGQGFLSRSLLIFGKGARQKITFPKVPDETTGLMLTNILMEIRKHAVGHAVLTPAAEDCLDEIYRSWNPIADVRLETYSGRRFTSLLKNCMILAVSDLNSFNARGVTITEEHVIYANSMLTFAEGFMSRALGNLGNNRNLEVQNKVTAVLEKTDKGMLLLDLHKHLTSEVDSIVQLGEVVKHMLALGKLALNAQTKRLFALASGPVTGKHCDFNLLREGQEYYAELDEPKHEAAPTLDEQFGLKVTEANDNTTKLIL